MGKCGLKVTTAERLLIACIRDELPDDEEVLSDFRFNHFPTTLEKCCLLRAPFSPLFFLERARSLLPLEDQHQDCREFTPVAKKEAYFFYAFVVSAGQHPHPQMSPWLDFGFCTCQNEREERHLGGLYQRLLGTLLPDSISRLGLLPQYSLPPKCGFTEFWTAHEEGSLVDLFNRCGLGKELHTFHHLPGFLSAPAWNMKYYSSGGGPVYPSVWLLKQYIANGNPWNDKFLPYPLQVDYGFRNCPGANSAKAELFKIYAHVLTRADPLELHQACIQGRLFDFCRKRMEIDSSMKPIMHNEYPLKKDPKGTWKWSGMSTHNIILVGSLAGMYIDLLCLFNASLSFCFYI
ncbi:hypothetical protein BT96DRAFT_830093 [Gymnopus androsaceus JB14]|uniref:Uncharacterized protein n=1 Tax=Gymnopus androsaceus JB14 TaxID=1447944 RepID=A0A6A4H5A4_9AGAR|nr:hypothetical protein BT96DRAFT_830093 [Gymnopus androsaceus JB14]